MTWKQIKTAAEKQGLSCKQVYELVVAQKPTTNSKSMPLLPRKKCEYIGELAYRCSRGDKAGYCDRCQ